MRRKEGDGNVSTRKEERRHRSTWLDSPRGACCQR